MVHLVGLTGGIACGKSTAAKLLKDEGATIIDADAVARAVLAPGTRAARRAAKVFKDDAGVVGEGGVINRERLGEVVFNDKAKRRALGQIMNTPIFLTMMRDIVWAWLTLPSSAVVVLDVPLLFETVVFALLCESVVVVMVPESVQVERIVARDGHSVEHAQQRIDAQMPSEEKARRATYLIDNTGTRDDLKARVHDIVADVRRQAQWVTPLRLIGYGLRCLGLGACLLLLRRYNYI